MSALVSLELVLDPATDAAIRAEWEALADAHLPSQARHTGASNRPHITLLVRSSLLDVIPVGDALVPLAVTLGAPVLFGGERHRVLARSVIPSAELLALHRRVHEAAGTGDDVAHTRPGEWTPHVTLARRLPVARVGEALGVLAAAGGGELRASAVGIRRWDAATRRLTNVAGHGTLEPC